MLENAKESLKKTIGVQKKKNGFKSYMSSLVHPGHHLLKNLRIGKPYFILDRKTV